MDYSEKKKIADEKAEQEAIVSEKKTAEQERLRICFAQRLKYACKDRNTNIYQISKQTGISSGLLGSYVKGEKSPTIYNAKIIADCLGVSLDWLCGEGDLSSGINPWMNYSIPNAFLAILDKYEPEIQIKNKSPYVVLSFTFSRFIDTHDNRKSLVEFLNAYSSLVDTINTFEGEYEDFNKFYIQLARKYKDKI